MLTSPPTPLTGCLVPVPGYVLYPQYDNYFGDLGNVFQTLTASTNLTLLASVCDSQGSGCVAFNSEGYLKAALGPAISWR